MKTKTEKDVKAKVKRPSKGFRLHIRRMKQEKRKEMGPVPPTVKHKSDDDKS